MDNKVITNIRLEIINLLDRRHLKLTFKRLMLFADTLNDWRLKEKIVSSETAYQYMLKYMEDGIVDPERDKLYAKLLSDAYSINDLIADKLLSERSNSLYYGKRRTFLSGNDSLDNCFKRLDNEHSNLALSDLLLPEENDFKKMIYRRHKIENESSALFNAIWTNFPSTEEDSSFLKMLFSDNHLSISYQSFMVSALTLTLLEWYDE